jgi:acyl carrier protein
VAWVVFAAGATATAAELREHLGERLPEPMVPSVFVPLDALPLTPNGKLDRRALPAPGGDRLGSGLPYVAPRNELESAIASIWAEVLGIERVGLHDSFFDLGGTSLTLVQVHGRLRSELGAELPVVELFRYPTVGEQARFLAEGRRAGASSAERRRHATGRLELLRRQRDQRRSDP